MLNEAPQYVCPLATAPATSVQDEALWEASVRAYGEGSYLASLSQLVRYLDPSASLDDGSQADDLLNRTVVLAHGSVRLHLSVTAEELSLRVPFLRLPQGGRGIALMRKSLEISSQLNLARFHLEDETLVIRYQDKLAGCHPAKLLDVMSCICRAIDSYDDLFAKKFTAERAEPHEVATWDGEKLEQAHHAFAQILDEAFALTEHWESKQNLSYAFYAIDMALDRLIFTLAVQGYVRSELHRIGGKLRNKKRSLPQRISEGRKSLSKLRALTAEELSESLYEATFIIPELRDYALGAYQGAVRELFENTTAMGHNRRYDQAVTAILHSIYEDLTRWRLPHQIRQIYADTLQQAAGLSWREAAAALSRGLEAVTNFEEEQSGESNDDFYQDAVASMQPHVNPKSQSEPA